MLKIKETIKLITFLLLSITILVGNGISAENLISNHSSKETKYFPEGDYYDSISDWYGKYLKALGEPSIYQHANKKNKKTFRFLWLRTFDNPIAIRLEISKDNKSGTLYVKMTDGKGGYEPGTIKEDYTKNISEERIDKFLKLLETNNFWKLPIKDENIGFDGAQWVIEGLCAGKYHLVDRWSPKEGAIRKIGLFLLGLSDINIDNEKIY